KTPQIARLVAAGNGRGGVSARCYELVVLRAAELQHAGSTSVKLPLDKRDPELIRLGERQEGGRKALGCLAFSAVDDEIGWCILSAGCNDMNVVNELTDSLSRERTQPTTLDREELLDRCRHCGRRLRAFRVNPAAEASGHEHRIYRVDDLLNERSGRFGMLVSND